MCTGAARSRAASPASARERGTYGYYEVNDFGTFGEAAANIAHIYAQDQWSIGNLTLNLGMRFENEVIPSFRTDLAENAVEFGFGDKIAPRFGAAYDVAGNGRMKIFGAYGRYYDWTKYELSRGAFGGDIWTVYYRSLDDPNWIQHRQPDNMPGRDLWGSASGFRDRRVPNFETVDPDLKPMSQDSFNLGTEFQTGPHERVLDQLRAQQPGSDHRGHRSARRWRRGLPVRESGRRPGDRRARLDRDAAVHRFRRPSGSTTPLQLELNRRFADNWFMGGSYVWSKLQGNYPGIASSDEIRTPTLGLVFGADQQQAGLSFRPGGNVNRAWDLDESTWDAHGNLDPQGPLATDRPHVFKLYGAYSFPFGTQIGGNFYAGSGTPLTTYVNTLNGIEVFVEGRGDMGRTDMLNYTDLLVVTGSADGRHAAPAVRAQRAERLQPEDRHGTGSTI